VSILIESSQPQVVLFLNNSASRQCSTACKFLPPPLNTLCDYIASLPHLCDDVVQWITNGDTPLEICSWVGLCNGGTCACGYCTGLSYARCLSVPGHCPKNASLPAHRPHVQANSNGADSLGVCLNGICSSQYVGCCLTCVK
jgi:hypothetical protein